MKSLPAQFSFLFEQILCETKSKEKISRQSLNANYLNG